MKEIDDHKKVYKNNMGLGLNAQHLRTNPAPHVSQFFGLYLKKEKETTSSCIMDKLH